jgi:hypothetical protein
MIYNPHQILFGLSNQGDGTYGRKKRCLRGFWCIYARERNSLNYLGINGSMLLKRILQKWDGDMYWIDLAQESVNGLL